MDEVARPLNSQTDDLFSPSLSEEHDAKGFDHPLSPEGLALLTFFCGLSGAGFFWADNWRRLGMSDRQLPTAIGILFWSVVTTTALQSLIFSGVMGPVVPGSLLTFGYRMLEILVAVALASSQKKRFDLFKLTEGPSGTFWIPIFGSIALTIMITITCMMLARWIVYFLLA